MVMLSPSGHYQSITAHRRMREQKGLVPLMLFFLSEKSCSMGAIFQERTKGDEKVTRALKEKRKMEGKENGHCDV